MRDMDGRSDSVGDGSRKHGIELNGNPNSIASWQGRHLGIAAIPINADKPFQILTKRLSPSYATPAVTAEEVEVGTDEFPNPLGVNACAHGDYSPHELVSGDPRKIREIVPQISSYAVQNCESDAAGLHVYKHLALGSAGDHPVHGTAVRTLKLPAPLWV
jgi:hypothetical protein